MADYLIKDGTVIDGTGAPGFRADVRVVDGTIAAVGPGLAADGATIVGAEGCYVTPGFIEGHTHYDAAMWWQADLDPLPGYGVTTAIMGNCGFTLAPLSGDEASRLETVKIFSFFEDIPYDTFLKEVPWDWKSWPEYKESLTRQVKVPLNYGLYVGHITLRLAAMGLDAWNRAATKDEIATMARLLDEALAAGALGLSDNMLDHDGEDRPVPSLLAEDDELVALFAVIARYPAASYQVILDPHMRKNAPESLDRVARLAKPFPIRIQAVGAAPMLDFQADLLPILETQVAEMRAAGQDVWPGFAHVAPTTAISICKSLLFAQANDYVWHEVVTEPDLEKKAVILRDPEWRARARESWDTQTWAWSPFQNPHKIILDNSDNGVGPHDIRLTDYAAELGVHPSDALAEWFLANGVTSSCVTEPRGLNEEKLVEMLNRAHNVGNLSDAGAHLQMLCGAGENMLLFTQFVRDGRLSLEQAIHVQTGKAAGFFNLHDRGEIKVGKRADITVFDLDEIERRKRERRYDVPDGKGGISWRFTRQAAPMRLTMVNGVVTFDGESFTGATPGELVSPVIEGVSEDEPALA